jgi:hypothetical protein
MESVLNCMEEWDNRLPEGYKVKPFGIVPSRDEFNSRKLKLETSNRHLLPTYSEYIQTLPTPQRLEHTQGSAAAGTGVVVGRGTDSLLSPRQQQKESKKDIYRSMHHESSPAPSDHGLDDDDTFDGEGDGYDDHGAHHLSVHANALLSRISTADESDDITPRNASPRRSLSQRSFGQPTAATVSAATVSQMLSMSNEVSAIHPNKSMNNTVEVQDFLSVDSMSEGGENTTRTTEDQHHRQSQSEQSQRQQQNRSSVIPSPDLVGGSTHEPPELGEGDGDEDGEPKLKPRIITKKQATVIGVNRAIVDAPRRDSYSVPNPMPTTTASDSSSKWVMATKADQAESHPAPSLPLAASVSVSRREEEGSLYSPRYQDREGDWELDRSQHQQRRMDQGSHQQDRDQESGDHYGDDYGNGDGKSVSTLHAEKTNAAVEAETEAISPVTDQYVFPADDSDSEDGHGQGKIQSQSRDQSQWQNQTASKPRDSRSRSSSRADVLDASSALISHGAHGGVGDDSALVPFDSISREDNHAQGAPAHHHRRSVGGANTSARTSAASAATSVSVPHLDISRSHDQDHGRSLERQRQQEQREQREREQRQEIEESAHLQRISDSQKASLLQTIYSSSPSSAHEQLPQPLQPRSTHQQSYQQQHQHQDHRSRASGGGAEMDLLIQRIRILEAESRARREQHELDEEKYRLSESSWSGEIISLKVFTKDLEDKLQEERSRNRKLLSELATRDAEISSLTG